MRNIRNGKGVSGKSATTSNGKRSTIGSNNMNRKRKRMKGRKRGRIRRHVKRSSRIQRPEKRGRRPAGGRSGAGRGQPEHGRSKADSGQLEEETGEGGRRHQRRPENVGGGAEQARSCYVRKELNLSSDTIL
jgi:hypothetical protein